MEEIMNRQNLRPQLVIVALALAASFAAVPAFAQRNPNDGGAFADPVVTKPSGAQSKTKTSAAKTSAAKTSAVKPAAAQLGRNVNDGGALVEPSAGIQGTTKPSSTASTDAAPARPGRNPNDGGAIQ
jgi:hypothetical protein